ncbi:MAG TPA: mechanosensitive ion channel domain-containing protein [Myxococcales bacterium]|nr:mechanosensitive ion channel domain-containing protein [Myxococcales bacterium]
MSSSLDPAAPPKLSLWRAFTQDLEPRHLVTLLVLLMAGWVLTRVINVGFKRTVERHRQHGTLGPETMTQLALARRLLDAGVWIGAIAIGISQFPELRLVSAGLLASAGVSGLIVGFAARSTLGNFVAGVSLSVTQPVRLGDDIEFRNERGVVEDIYFTYTVVRLGDGRRLIIPNDILASEVIKNATMGGVTRVGRAEVLVPPQGSPEDVRAGLLKVANEYEGLDRSAGPPEVYYVRVDERGTLLRLVATCTDNQAADRLVQRALARAAQAVFRRAT